MITRTAEKVFYEYQVYTFIVLFSLAFAGMVGMNVMNGASVLEAIWQEVLLVALLGASIATAIIFILLIYKFICAVYGRRRIRVKILRFVFAVECAITTFRRCYEEV